MGKSFHPEFTDVLDTKGYPLITLQIRLCRAFNIPSGEASGLEIDYGCQHVHLSLAPKVGTRAYHDGWDTH